MATLGLQGYWIWDGLDDKKLKLPVGTYIVFTEIFNLDGKKENFKNIVVLARNQLTLILTSKYIYNGIDWKSNTALEYRTMKFTN